MFFVFYFVMVKLFIVRVSQLLGEENNLVQISTLVQSSWYVYSNVNRLKSWARDSLSLPASLTGRNG